MPAKYKRNVSIPPELWSWVETQAAGAGQSASHVVCAALEAARGGGSPGRAAEPGAGAPLAGLPSETTGEPLMPGEGLPSEIEGGEPLAEDEREPLEEEGGEPLEDDDEEPAAWKDADGIWRPYPAEFEVDHRGNGVWRHAGHGYVYHFPARYVDQWCYGLHAITAFGRPCEDTQHLWSSVPAAVVTWLAARPM